jgi:hypothetical protein
MKKTVVAIAAPLVICSFACACGSAPQGQDALDSTQTQEASPTKKEALTLAPVSTVVAPPTSGISIFPWWLYESPTELYVNFPDIGKGPSGAVEQTDDPSCSVDWSSRDEVAVPASLASGGCVAGVTYKFDKNDPSPGGPIWACPSSFTPSAAYVVFDVGNVKSTWSPSACVPPAVPGWELVRDSCNGIPTCLVFGNMGCNGPCSLGH